ncbi:uncharacterized protein B4U79_04577, partial [Dinothrombium tinctorium]
MTQVKLSALSINYEIQKCFENFKIENELTGHLTHNKVRTLMVDLVEAIKSSVTSFCDQTSTCESENFVTNVTTIISEHNNTSNSIVNQLQNSDNNEMENNSYGNLINNSTQTKRNFLPSKPKNFFNSDLNNNFKIFSSNVRSIVSKLQEFQLYVSEEKPDVIMICESWLKDNIPNKIILKNYTIYRNDRESRGGG